MKMRNIEQYLRLPLAFILILMLLGIPVMASDITGANYYGTILVVNNGTAETYQSSNITNIKVASFVDGGYVASASNTTMAMRTTSGADVAFQPGYGNSAWMTWVSGIGENESLNYLFYTGNITGGKVRYFPGAAGMTTSYSATLGLAANFTIEQAGYIDTSVGADKNLVYKQDAFRLYTGAVDEEVTASIEDAGTIGSAAVNRAATSSANQTIIVIYNPAAASGTITEIKVWSNTDLSADFTVGTFYGTGGTNYKCRDSEVVGAIVAGAERTVGVTISMVTGDYIGCWSTTGVHEYDTAGGGDLYYIAGEFIDPGDETTYGLGGDDTISLGGITLEILSSVTATGVASGEHTVKVGLELR